MKDSIVEQTRRACEELNIKLSPEMNQILDEDIVSGLEEIIEGKILY